MTHAVVGGERPTLENVVEYFNPATNSKIHAGTPPDVVHKRVHSKGYHNLRSWLNDNCAPLGREAIDIEASVFGIACLEAWKKKFQ